MVACLRFGAGQPQGIAPTTPPFRYYQVYFWMDGMLIYCIKNTNECIK